jgi:hypothetical protein
VRDRDSYDYMQALRDTWAENETQRPIRRNGRYPIDEDDTGRMEPFVIPEMWKREGEKL